MVLRTVSLELDFANHAALGLINHLLASGDSECADGDWSGAFKEPSPPYLETYKPYSFQEEATVMSEEPREMKYHLRTL